MQRLLNALTHKRTMTVFGLLVVAVILFGGALWFDIPLGWPGAAFAALVLIVLVVWLWRRLAARRANSKLGEMLEQQAQADKAAAVQQPAKQAELDVLRTRLVDAVRTIKTSKIGQISGGSALYELPWYIVIGNPAAGKSSAVLNSGLQFPFADKNDAV